MNDKQIFKVSNISEYFLMFYIRNDRMYMTNIYLKGKNMFM